MMSKQSRIDILKATAQQKKQQALERTEQAISRLIQAGKRITFSSVAQTAGVSVSYLYKYHEIKERIQVLRQQPNSVKKQVSSPPPSDRSRAVIIDQLRQRIQRLEADKQELRQQQEAIYGRFYQLQASVQPEVEGLRQANASLKAENAWLKAQLALSASPAPASVMPPLSDSDTQPGQSSEVDSQIQAELSRLGVELNPTLNRTIGSTTPEIVLTAIEALKEAMMNGSISKPGGWLKRAIEESWRPNQPIPEKEATGDLNQFSQWFNLARSKGLVAASMRGDDGELYVFDREGVRYSFEQMLARHPWETLKD